MFKKWFLLTNSTSGSMVSISFKWYHISTCGVNHTRWWFHKWSSTLSDHQRKKSSLTIRAQAYQIGWPMLWHRGRCPTNWYQGQTSYVWYPKSYTNGVIPTYVVLSIKNVRFKCQPSIPRATLCIKRCIPYMEIDDKGERLYKDMRALGEIETKK